MFPSGTWSIITISTASSCCLRFLFVLDGVLTPDGVFGVPDLLPSEGVLDVNDLLLPGVLLDESSLSSSSSSSSLSPDDKLSSESDPTKKKFKKPE